MKKRRAKQNPPPGSVDLGDGHYISPADHRSIMKSVKKARREFANGKGILVSDMRKFIKSLG